jgi:ABC-2 type transport system ATP-binding protein
MSVESPILEVNDVRKTYRFGFLRRRVEAVRGVSFSVPRGAVFGLLGPNGAGKTTTIKMLMGLVAPDGGSFRILGRSGRRAAARGAVGFLPENPYFHEYLNPRELLEFYGQLCGLDRATIRSRRDALLEQVGLTEAARRPLRKFSKGMLQRIGLAQALIGQPQLLVLDEPMSGLDPIGRRQVADLLVELSGAGTTIVFASHILSDVERLCDRVVILNRGRKVAAGTIEELVGEHTGAESLESLFLREALKTEADQDAAGTGADH